MPHPSIALAPAFALLAGASPAFLQKQDAEEQFEKKVRPLFAAHCYECHGKGAERVEGGLLLEDGGWMRGDSGPAVVPGDPDASRLIQAVRYTNHDLEMPPAGKLSDEQIRILEDWVRAGAQGARDASKEKAAPVRAPSPAEAARDFWAFASYGDPKPPSVQNASWPRGDLDRFVLAKLEAAGLEPAPPADRRTWLRRVTWDLTGLPPTPSEIQQFEEDRSERAFEIVVERLLASPAYGERWARHWLDVARYADSNGLDENLAIANAWRYRDYVVRAFQEDKPYHQFVTEQLAGDLLPEPEDAKALKDQLTATGFLVLGPKMLAEQDKEKLLMDTVDEQVDVAGKAFLGLTLGCARCHDHKFDPISQRDYYAMAGIFRSTATFANTGFVSRWRQSELASSAERKERDAWMAARQSAGERLEKLSRDAREEWLSSRRADFARYLCAATAPAREIQFFQAEDLARGTLGVDRNQWGSAETVIVRTTMAGPQFAEYDVVVPEGGSHDLYVRYASAERRPMRVMLDGALAAEALAESTGSFFPDGQRWKKAATLSLKPGKNTVRLEATVASVPHLDALLLARGAAAAPLGAGAELEPEILQMSAVMLASTARTKDSVLELWHRAAALPSGSFSSEIAPLWSSLRAERAAGSLSLAAPVGALLDAPAPSTLEDLAARYQAVLATVDAQWRAAVARARAEKRPEPKALEDKESESLRQIYHGSSGPFALTDAQLESKYTKEVATAIADARTEVDSLEKRKPKPFELAPAVADGPAMDLPIHIRGSHLNKAKDAVPRGFLSILGQALPAPPIPQGSSGRLELARWITDPKNPLAARVMVNRIWQGHFGEGIVRTPSNFGLRGDPPSHPELLDWLAARFVECGWSVKSMHRMVVLSSTYRMSSFGQEKARALDPENRLLSRMPRRRLDAESIRDGALAVSGRLDRAVGGTLLSTADGDYVTNDQSSNQARYASPRRSLYLPIIRNAMFDLFTSFDYNDASVAVDRRPVTTGAPQSLFLLNSPLFIESAGQIASAVASLPDDGARIREAWRRILLRDPAAEEVSFSAAFVERARKTALSSEMLAWRGLCQALLASNEFLYVD
ncbi:MAG: DUF1549 domain-containing protein [Planctomycetes bacterium]|nr:DUF1549 domain-containing protein [Planctomycetota bacterium]